MPLPRFAKLDPARQDAILSAAETEFSAHGFSGASLNTIIKGAGLSKGAMYYYFEDKADLCRTVLDRVFARLWQATGDVGEFDDAAGFWDQVVQLCDRAMACLFASPDLGQLGRLLYDEGPSIKVLEPLEARAERWCADLLGRGQTVGAVCTDLPISLLATAVTGLVVHTDRWMAREMHKLDAPQEIETLGRAILNMVQRVAEPVPQ